MGQKSRTTTEDGQPLRPESRDAAAPDERADGQAARQSAPAETERELAQARYAEIAALAGGLAHEIRNPLSTINLNLELLLEDASQLEWTTGRRILNKLQVVQRECAHLDAILEGFLKFVRIEQLDLTRTDLNDVVDDFIESFQAKADEDGMELSPHLAINLSPVCLDRSLFRQVLLNLALNAVQAMPEGGVLELQTHQRGDRVLLDLIDTGRGMDERTRSRIFDAFFSTRPGGSGLGLPAVARIVEAHGGTICCESEPGRGTQFTISLPAAPAT
ncbi:MAG: two-component sensor histidine kinase [Planctomycetaceae bacterium]|nr:two-component sensor histidine kinase [Planctomycetaceae bacterium]